MTTKYSKRTWLNPNESSSTGSVVAFDGEYEYEGKIYDSTFLEIADCKRKVSLHLGSEDTPEQFIEKMKLLRSEIDLFIHHLEKQDEKK